MGVDNLPGAEPLETAELPERCVLLFGQARPARSTPAWPPDSHAHLDPPLDPPSA